MSKISPVLARRCQMQWCMSSSSSLHLGHGGDTTSPAQERRSCVQHDAVAAASNMPRAACMPLLSKSLSCLNSVVRWAPPSKPGPNSCPAAFSHSCPSRKALKACQKPQSPIPNPPVLRLHRLPSGSFQDVCDNDSRQMAHPIPPTHGWISRHHRSRNFCPHLLNLGPDSAFPKHKPLSDEIARDQDCWIRVWMQECSWLDTYLVLRIELFERLSSSPA